MGYWPYNLAVEGITDSNGEATGFIVVDADEEDEDARCALLTIEDVDDHPVALLREIVRRYNEYPLD